MTSKQTKREKLLLSIAILLMGYLLCSYNIGNTSIYILDEAKNATCAKEMLAQNDYIVPTFNGELRTDKPILHYYFMILGYKIFGVNAMGARFFSAVMGSLVLLITFLFGYTYLGKRSALLAILVMLSSTHFLLQFHLAVPDPYLIFFTIAGMFSFYHAFKSGVTFFFYLAYIAVALGVLSKGPIAIVLPGVSLLIFLLWERALNRQTLIYIRPIQGIILISLITLPWYLAVGVKTDWEWTRGFFLQHNLNRFADPMEGHGGIPGLSIGYLFLGLLPFSVFILPAILSFIQHKAHNSTLRYLSSIVGFIILFFSFSGTQLPNYIVPAYPLFALIIADFLSQVISAKYGRRAWRIGSLVFSIIVILIPIGIYIGLREDALLCGIKYLAWWYIVPSLIGVLVLYMSIHDKRELSIILQALSFVVLSLISFGILYPKIDSQNTVSQAFKVIHKEVDAICYKRMNRAFAFHYDEPVPIFRKMGQLEAYKQNRKAPFYILTQQRYLAEFQPTPDTQLIFKRQDLFDRTTTVILKVTP